MKLRKPCEHKDRFHPEGRYEPHGRRYLSDGRFNGYDCPGGEFLADDALVVERLADRELYRGVKRFISDWHAGALPVRPFHDVDSDATFNETTVREGAG